ncbi:methyltransferase [Halorussus gelatinilyticus]|uniref:Methyltransferase n=1 Tax=Halorussus gelatinilyticus TaxID=2937524 RepID=A0A8U0IGN1_9EURY|nr:methyltransferase [Halorussus gelatinilyticus]UPV99218.1 methyltransferase [Halorussus gelatinilyticus]
MPVNPNFLERLLLFGLDRAPTPMLDLFGAAGFEAVALASKLGVFDALGERELTLQALADELDASEAGLAPFLAFLDAQRYVAEDGGRYRNTTMTRKWLVSDSETNVAPWLVFWDELVFPFWDEHLETVVREGEPPRTIYEWFDEEPSRWDLAQRGFRAAASVLVDEVSRKVDVPRGATRLLDVGGGHGLYAADLCRRRPGLEATVFDYPEALSVARAEIAESGLGDRMRVRGGDYWSDDLGDGYDIALVFNVIHANDPAENVRLFERVADALAPGGRIVVLDQLEGSASMPVSAAGLRFVGLTYRVTLDAAVHPYRSVADWLTSAGFERVGRTPIRRASPGNALVQATKSA